jgi:hypothetical protein
MSVQFVDQYGHYPYSLCGSSKDGSDLYKEAAADLGLNNKHLAILYDVLNERPPQL